MDSTTTTTTSTNNSGTSTVVLNLQSNDGRRFRITEKAARLSTVLRELLEHTAGNEEPQEEEPPFSCDCDGKTLEKVVAWLEHHQDTQEPVIDEEFEQTAAWDDFRNGKLDAWNEAFLGELDFNTDLMELFITANFLDIKNLSAYIGKVIANAMAGKSTEEMRRILGSALADDEAAETDVKEELDSF